MSLAKNQILIFVVTYNAANHISDTLDRISRDWLGAINYEILIVDDASQDGTTSICESYKKDNPDILLHVQSNSQNLGYGGNQKIGYAYAIEKGFDFVVLLHGDGQYAPEYLHSMLSPLQNKKADVVLGSRMLDKYNALKGQMPLYKWLGNIVLTFLQNLLLGSKFAEFHTGFRAFSVSKLMELPLEKNSNYFDFDTEIIIQLWDRKARFKEVAIPTFYGDEVSYVNGFKYAWLIVKATIVSRLVKGGWYSDPRFNDLTT